nr:unnamed protein product [Callosobruchus chinensis]
MASFYFFLVLRRSTDKYIFVSITRTYRLISNSYGNISLQIGAKD